MIAAIGGKRAGIIGGLGPKTGLDFALSLNNRCIAISNSQPDLVLENVPVPKSIEQAIILGDARQEMKELLIKAVCHLNSAEVDFIVVPCNSVHVFIDELRMHSTRPIMSIIEETANHCKRNGFSTVGLLATSTTIREKLHATALAGFHIRTLLPDTEDQARIDDIILTLLNSTSTEEDVTFMQRILSDFKAEGADAAILGCTDFHLLIDAAKSPLPLVDTLHVLEETTVRLLLGGAV